MGECSLGLSSLNKDIIITGQRRQWFKSHGHTESPLNENAKDEDN